MKKRAIKGTLSKLIDRGDLDGAIEVLEECKASHDIHLGKNSAGWKFLFNANKLKYYPLTRQGITDFIRKSKSKIVDEYGREVGIDEFWKIVDSSKDGWDIAAYYKECPEDESPYYSYYSYDKELYKDFDVDKYGEFESDGLRFTTWDEFS